MKDEKVYQLFVVRYCRAASLLNFALSMEILFIDIIMLNFIIIFQLSRNYSTKF